MYVVCVCADECIYPYGRRILISASYSSSFCVLCQVNQRTPIILYFSSGLSFFLLHGVRVPTGSYSYSWQGP
jgi:hypothetical protein